MKKILLAASLAALMAYPAFAQEAPNPASPAAPAEKAAPAPESPGTGAAPSAEPSPAIPSVDPEATTPDKSASTAMPTDKLVGLGSEVAASDLLNQKVKNSANETVGDINDLSIGSDGKIAAVIIGVGGFLGMGEKNVQLPYDQLTFSRDASGYLVVTANITKESLQSAPEWKKPSKS
jgi:nucleoid-associated protein YgaU